MPGLRESLEKLKKTAWRELAEVYEQGAAGFYVMGREKFDRLLRSVFGRKALLIYGCEVGYWNFGDLSGGKFYEGLGRLEKLIVKMDTEYLEFGNEDLNGWSLVAWRIRKGREKEQEILGLVKELEGKVA